MREVRQFLGGHLSLPPFWNSAARVAAATIVVASLVAATASSSSASPVSKYCGEVEGFEIRAEGIRTRCGFARATMKKVRHLAFHTEGRGLTKRFHIRVRHHRLTCRNFYVNRAQTIVCRGRQRTVRLQYTLS
jgi:hypothetical protein